MRDGSTVPISLAQTKIAQNLYTYLPPYDLHLLAFPHHIKLYRMPIPLSPREVMNFIFMMMRVECGLLNMELSGKKQEPTSQQSFLQLLQRSFSTMKIKLKRKLKLAFAFVVKTRFTYKTGFALLFLQPLVWQAGILSACLLQNNTSVFLEGYGIDKKHNDNKRLHCPTFSQLSSGNDTNKEI